MRLTLKIYTWLANGFSRFGIAGVMASSYYLAKEILKDEALT